MLTFIPSLVLTYLIALAAMAFFTLLERKILGYSQERKGPNKVSLLGLPQPLADAAKLFTKEPSVPKPSNLTPFYISPAINLSLALLLWTLIPSASPIKFISYGIIFFLCVSSLSVYTTLGAGWTSNSKYALLGALRSVAQTISYEVSMALILISILATITSFNLQNILSCSQFNMALMSPILAFMWFTTMLAETNRSPFDFAEGESELVSGFNTEYASGLFALIFMSEYLNIMFMSMITGLIIAQNCSLPTMAYLFLIIKTVALSTLFLNVRASYPRMRYDRLMNLTWMSFLPLTLMLLTFWTPLY